MSDKTKRKISEKTKGISKPSKIKKSVYVYDILGNLVHIFYSRIEAKNSLKCGQSKLLKLLEGKDIYTDSKGLFKKTEDRYRLSTVPPVFNKLS